MNEDQLLIEEVKIIYDAKDLKELSEMETINIPYITLLKWNSNGIPKSGTGKQYLQSLLKIKKLEKQKKIYEDFFDSFNAIINYKNLCEIK